MDESIHRQHGKEMKPMEDKIQWETELDAALRKAKSANKPVILDFFNPG